MKISYLTLAFAFAVLLMACCQKEEETPALENLECGALFTALLEVDDAALDAIMDGICADYPPSVTNDDPYGHQANLNDIIEALNEQCPTLNASFGCYACEESLPPWSFILFSLDSAGVTVERYAHLLTPSDGPMRSNW